MNQKPMFHESRARWLETAQNLTPRLQTQRKTPRRFVRAVPNADAFQGWRIEDDDFDEDVFRGRGESLVLDFGEYVVGHFAFGVVFQGAVDAPTRLKLTFGEVAAEIGEPFDPYHGVLSRAWLQDETVTLDDLPQTVRLPCRYAFRFIKIEIIDTSPSFKIRLENFACETVSSADWNDVPTLPISVSAEARQLDAVSLHTLAACMQTVFEDGPKRDRRLWIGDLRLQALTNSVSFGNHDLTKRCLYLFAAFAHDNGLVPACVFETPEPHRGHCDILDYVALFVPTLLEYAQASGDWETARDLWPVALNQLHRVLDLVSDDGLFVDPGDWWIFIDWHEQLDKRTAMHGVLLFCLHSAVELAAHLGFDDQVVSFHDAIARLSEAARTHWFDADLGLFVSGETRQISWASQIWMVLAQVVSPEVGAAILQKLPDIASAIRPAGPYLYHYAVEALLHCGLADDAKELLFSYWGGMIEVGATTFWEVYDPQNPRLSPYNSHLVNSYCHAWSCTPALFVRRFPQLFSTSIS